MSKQSNQRYRKELEKKTTQNNFGSNGASNCSDSIKTTSTQNQPNRYDYGDGDFDAPSNSCNHK